jgi:hypothetical protein
VGLPEEFHGYGRNAVAFQLAIGSAGEVYREAGRLAKQRHDEVAAALKAELARYHRPNGVVMDSRYYGANATSNSVASHRYRLIGDEP